MRSCRSEVSARAGTAVPLVALAALLGACAGVGLHTDYDHLSGYSRVIYPVHFDRAWEAALATLEAQGVRIVNRHRLTGEGKIRGLRQDQQPVFAELVVRGPSDTKVSIRVGESADRQGAEALQRALAAHLGMTLPF